MSEINWKNKYSALKAKFMESVDAAFRLGYEQGQQEAQMDAVMQQQQAQADQMQQQQEGQDAGGGAGEDNNSDPSAEVANEAPADEQASSAHPGGSELEQHISKLESMVAKGEISTHDLLKSLGDFRSIQKNMVEKIKFDKEMKKSHEAIPAIAKALHKPSFKVSQQANANMNDTAKRAVGMQQKIVSEIMKSWADEEAKASKGILGALNIEGLIKKD